MRQLIILFILIAGISDSTAVGHMSPLTAASSGASVSSLVCGTHGADCPTPVSSTECLDRHGCAHHYHYGQATLHSFVSLPDLEELDGPNASYVGAVSDALFKKLKRPPKLLPV